MNEINLKNALKYPFNNYRNMWNILWVLLPFLGWFALIGYCLRIIQEFIDGKFKQLPDFKFGHDLIFGLSMFLKSIPFIIVCLIIYIQLGIIAITLNLFYIDKIVELILYSAFFFIVPLLFINFVTKKTIGSFFEISILKMVFINFKDYILVILKTMTLFFIFLLMSLLAIGIPAGIFTCSIFLSDFYRKNVR